MNRPVVQKMIRLMRLRSTHEAFNGEFRLLASDSHTLYIRWEKGVSYAELRANFESLSFTIRFTENGEEKEFY